MLPFIANLQSETLVRLAEALITSSKKVCFTRSTLTFRFRKSLSFLAV